MPKTLSATGARWELAKPAPDSFLGQFPEYPRPIAQLLYNRGLRDDQSVGAFLNPVYTRDLHSPRGLSGMDAAVGTIQQSIKDKEPIVIHGDYDADGLTATAVLHDVLTRLGATVTTFIPSRYREGYGVSEQALLDAREAGAGLVITVDCGIGSQAAIAAARAQGLKVVVTDHHLPPKQIPEAEAVINPNLPNDTYPNKGLTGVGVAFKLAQALLDESDLPPAEAEAAEKWLLDLVAIGTVADVASLLGENRALVQFGLKVLAKGRRPGLLALMRAAGIDRSRLTGSNIGFGLAPRLNASGRLTNAQQALELLLTKDSREAERIASGLNRVNMERQELTARAVDQAKQQLGRLTDDDRIIVLDGHWLSGIVGLVAGRLSREFSRPALVIERGKEVSKGSARSIPALNISEALAAHSAFLTTYGGHAQAAGFSLPTAKLEAFRRRLQEFARQTLSADDCRKTVAIEAQLKPAEIDFPLVELLERFEPFGINNPKPQFLLKRVQIGESEVIGKDRRHLKMTLELPGGTRMTALAFGMAEQRAAFKRGVAVDLVGAPVINTFNNTKSLEWHVADCRRHA